MAKKLDMMKKFDFLLGNWDMESNIPKSAFSKAATGTGEGTFKRALDDKYVYFDYSNGEEGAAHVIITWDEKSKVYRFWWFESSGNFSNAVCNFVNKKTLFLNWQDSLMIQTFRKTARNKVILRMEHPDSEGRYELVMEIIFTKKIK
jgi:hypothetical protein